MANPVITNVDLGCVALGYEQFADDTLTFAAADTFVEGTILARRAVAEAVTIATITRAGTSNGTVTLATVVGGSTVPKVGAYVLTCIEAIANGGVWKLVDPDGALVSGYLLMTAGAGAATVFEAGGLQFTVTDGTNNFEVGDFTTLTVAADGKLVPFVSTGAGGVQVPCAVLTYEVTKAAGGDLPCRVLIGGQVNRNRLIIDADGTGANVTNAVCDALRARHILPIEVTQHSVLDNQ
jgi:hypothetical protein